MLVIFSFITSKEEIEGKNQIQKSCIMICPGVDDGSGDGGGALDCNCI